MIETISELPTGVVGIEATGRVTSDDYKQTVKPWLESIRREGKRVGFMYHMGPEFEGFTPGAALQDFRVGVEYLRLFRKCAIVTDVEWVKKSASFVAAMLPCPVRTFDNDEYDDAVAWLSSAVDDDVVEHQLIPDKSVLLIKPHRPLNRQDFEALSLLVDPWIETHGSLNGIVIHAESFPGWESLGSFFRHMQFVKDHHRKVRRVALVADSSLAEMVPALAKHFVEADLKHFDSEDVDVALTWAAR